jgi:hypothetical protein
MLGIIKDNLPREVLVETRCRSHSILAIASRPSKRMSDESRKRASSGWLLLPARGQRRSRRYIRHDVRSRTWQRTLDVQSVTRGQPKGYLDGHEDVDLVATGSS